MSRVLVEFPINEAEAMLKRLGIDPLSRDEQIAAADGKDRLERAVKIERGASGSAERPEAAGIADRAEGLVGQPVVIYTMRGRRQGTLEWIRSTRLLTLREGRMSRTVPVDLVTSIRPVNADDGLEAA